MKKLFLFLFASMLSISMFADEVADGSAKARAIPYAWGEGIKVVSDAGVGKWYKVDLYGKFDPLTGRSADGNADANIVVSNPLDEVAHVDVTAYLRDNETSRSFTLKAGEFKTMNIGAGMLVRMGIQYVYMFIVMDVTVTESDAEKIHVVVDDVPSNSTPFVPVPFNWGENYSETLVAEGNTIPANKETWLAIDWLANMDDKTNNTFVIYAQNLGTKKTTVYGGLAMDCPATSIQEQTKEINPGSPMTKELEPAMLDMAAGTIYVRIKADQPMKVWAKEVAPTVPAEPIFNASGAESVAKNTVYNLGGADIFKADYAALTAPDFYYVQVEITNNGSEDAELTGYVVRNATGEVFSAVKRSYTVKAGKTIKKQIDNSMLKNLGSEDFAVAKIAGGNSNISFKLVEVCTEKDPCVPAQAIDMVIPATGSEIKNQAANSTKWYAVDVTAARDAKADIKLTMTADETAELTVDIAASCAIGEPTQSYTGSSKSTTKTLSYSLFKDAGDVVYVRVHTNKAITVKAEIVDLVRYTGSPAAWTSAPSTDKVARIESDLTIDGELKVLGITLAGGNITIASTGKLIVGKEGFKGSETVGQIIIQEGGNLMIDPAAKSNNKPFITAYKSLSLGAQTGAVYDTKHEFIALPVENRENSPVGLYYSNWTYTTGWGPVDGFRHAFVGYNVAESSLNPYCGYFAGQLAPNQNQTLNMPGRGWHAFGNSWLVPIQVTDMLDHVGSADRAIYLYMKNPITIGSVEYSVDHGENTKQYVPVTEAIIAAAAGQIDLSMVKPMEGFFLYTETATNATLNYNSLYNAHKAPAKRAEDNRNMAAVVLCGGNASDFVYMIEGEDANAHKMESNGLAIYAEDGLAQVANSNLIGTKLSIQTNNATEYTLSFTWLKGETMYLKDMVNGNIIAMTAENTYTFTAVPNTISERFQVVGRNEVPTNIENTFIEGANKFIENGRVVIIKNGVKYDVMGVQL